MLYFYRLADQAEYKVYNVIVLLQLYQLQH